LIIIKSLKTFKVVSKESVRDQERFNEKIELLNPKELDDIYIKS
jgi:hypothetical protein